MQRDDQQRPVVPNRALLNNQQLWTRVNFDVQLGFKITEDEVPFEPRATVDLNGNPAIPEIEDGEVRIRRISMSYPPHRAATLNVESSGTVHAAFMCAVKKARSEGCTEFFVNLGVKAKRKTLIENSHPMKDVLPLPGPPAPARLTL